MTEGIAMQRAVLTVTATDSSTAAEPEVAITSPVLDRMRDRVLPDGAVVDNFLRNPVLNYGHMREPEALLPIGTVTQLWRVGARWRMRWRWLVGDPFAARVQNAWEQNVLRAASIEFLGLEAKPNAEGGLDYTRWELLGVALCALPANPEAVRACKALGLPVHGSADELVLHLLDDSDSADDVILHLVDDEPERYVFDMSEAELRRTIAATLRPAITDRVRAAIRLRGRR